MAPTASSPSPGMYPSYGRRWQSTKPMQKLNTSVPLTVTPATSSTPNGHSSITLASPSNRTSISSSPDGPQARSISPSSASPTALQLPESSVNTTPSKQQYKNAMSEAMEQSKAPGLMRRISQGARNRIRRRTSSSQIVNRDRSSGPVMLRKRSNSKAVEDIDDDLVDSAAELDIGDVPEDIELVHGLGITSGRLSRGLSLENTTTALKPARTEGGIAPVAPEQLRQGTKLIKVSQKQKKKVRTFILDAENAKVSWDPTNPTKSFYIDDIQEIRLQSEAQISLETYEIPADSTSRCFTVKYADKQRTKGKQQKTIYLVAETPRDFELWTSTLQELSKHRHDLMAGLAASWQDDKTLKAHWKCEMARIFEDRPHLSEDESLDLKSIESLCRSLYIYCSPNVIRAQFEKADSQSQGRLNYKSFKDFVRRLKDRKDIREIFKSICPENCESIDLDGFLGFLKSSQGIDVDARRDHWIKVFSKYVRKSETPNPSTVSGQQTPGLLMGYSAFTAFLYSPANAMLNTKTSDAHFDRPLNEYFISSSHNTYLLGRQVNGKSSVEPYVRALQKGCRCVEIDCWDGPDGRPLVNHGHTMTSSVLFSDCVSTVAKYAFHTSDYPLIISLEVHCNASQQQKMVDIMIKEFDGSLIREPLKPNSLELPSPEELKNRILIKVKAGSDPALALDTALNRPELALSRRDRSSSSPWMGPQRLDSSNLPIGVPLSSPPSVSPPDHISTWPIGRSSITTTSISSATEDSDDGRNDATPARRSARGHKSKIISTLANLAVYTRGIKFQNNSFALEESRQYNHVFSLAERRFEDICKKPDDKLQLEKHNAKHLMRIYPSGFRFNSTNPDPLAFWRRGVQMVALNWQTYDLPMQLNEAMFASGADRLGYVLKPREIREPRNIQEEIESPSVLALGKIQKKVIRFSVDVISGQQLPRPHGIKASDAIDPYVEIELFSAEDKAKGIASGTGGHDASARHGMSGIGSPHRRRTHVISSNGFNPQFNESFGLSLETKYPSLVFVRWTVWDSQDGQNYQTNTNLDPLATFTAKLSSIQEGYRHIPLFDHNGEQFMFATLFCRIRKEDPVTVEREDPVPEKTGRFKSRFKRTLSQRNGKRSTKSKTSNESMKSHETEISSLYSPSLTGTAWTSSTTSPLLPIPSSLDGFPEPKI
ncbi:uncharacterized protein KY384_008101 [Bacidia gigantensis]|uniref:uncharacterized protein n=1 Tax=Bacidia gigantensis TaxID=2732470 RepID=UPI001D047E22|nr:uncharacterized protein KY384_008101 [Bacidia gigantensis]KAG8526672.1 hypothetical protein KY384_008101 [Bacidia gigantensis]